MNTQKNNPMTAEDIKEALLKVHPNLTLALFAKEAGIAGTTLSNLIHRRFTSKRVALLLCKTLQKTPQEVFPDVPMYSAPTGSDEDAKNIIKQRLNA